VYSDSLLGRTVGGKIGSTAILRAFSTTFGINFCNRGHETSRQGFVLTYRSQGLKLESTKKSIPNNSNPVVFSQLMMGWEAAATIFAIRFIAIRRSLIFQL
jgi:hypothetical protein